MDAAGNTCLARKRAVGEVPDRYRNQGNGISAEGAPLRRHLVRRSQLPLAALLLLAIVVPSALAAAKPPALTLKAASTRVPVGTPVRLTVTVVSSTAPYEVRILKNTSTGWVKVATATLVAPGKYTAFVTFTAKGKRTLKAAYVNASGAMTAYSGTVTVTVT